jgi:hypothetical protein
LLGFQLASRIRDTEGTASALVTGNHVTIYPIIETTVRGGSAPASQAAAEASRRVRVSGRAIVRDEAAPTTSVFLEGSLRWRPS